MIATARGSHARKINNCMQGKSTTAVIVARRWDRSHGVAAGRTKAIVALKRCTHFVLFSCRRFKPPATFSYQRANRRSPFFHDIGECTFVPYSRKIYPIRRLPITMVKQTTYSSQFLISPLYFKAKHTFQLALLIGYNRPLT